MRHSNVDGGFAEQMKNAGKKVALAMAAVAIGAGPALAEAPTAGAKVWSEAAEASEAPVVLARDELYQRGIRRYIHPEDDRGVSDETLRKQGIHVPDGTHRYRGKPRRYSGKPRRYSGKHRRLRPGKIRRYHGAPYYYDDGDNDRDNALAIIGGIVAAGAAAAILNNAIQNDEPGYRSAPGGHPGGCERWADACADNWGVNNSNFYGCLRYHGCD